jgi:predicted nucleotidyltransferase
MQRNEIIRKLRNNADAMRDMGATSLFLFGSAARGEATEESDIDLFIDYDSSRAFSLIDLVGFKQFLEEQMAMEVDITTRDSLHPMLKVISSDQPIACSDGETPGGAYPFRDSCCS